MIIPSFAQKSLKDIIRIIEEMYILILYWILVFSIFKSTFYFVSVITILDVCKYLCFWKKVCFMINYHISIKNFKRLWKMFMCRTRERETKKETCCKFEWFSEFRWLIYEFIVLTLQYFLSNYNLLQNGKGGNIKYMMTNRKITRQNTYCVRMQNFILT